MSQKTVHISAYVNGNLGDDLFVRILCDRYKDCKFTLVGARKNKYLFEDIHNLHYICEDKLRYKVLTKLYNLLKGHKNGYKIYRDKLLNNLFSRRCTVSVLISGSIFIESPTRLAELKMEHDWYSLKPVIMGCNFGPYKTEEFYNTCKEYFKMARQISFRDKPSYTLFKDLKNVSYAPDVVFNLNHNTRNEGYYCISVMDFETVDYGNWKACSNEYIKKIAQVADGFVAKNIPVVLISFCENLGDDKAVKQVLSCMEDISQVTVCSYDKDGMNKALDIMANAKGIMASRFHALVLGILFQKEVYPICYSKKMENLLSCLQIDCDIHYVDEFIKIPYEEIIEDFFDMSKVDVAKIRKAASAHFNQLDVILK